MFRITILVLAFTAEMAIAQAPSGSISGSILGDDGAPITGVTVHCRRAPIFTRDRSGRAVMMEAALETIATSTSNGSFRISGLSKGLYHLCPQPTQASQTSDCGWEEVSSISVADGQSVNGVVRYIHSGTTLTVVINDPNSRIDMPDSKGHFIWERRFALSVMVSPHHYVAAVLATSPAGQKVFRLVVPRSRAYRFFIDTSLQITDSSARAVELIGPSSLLINTAELDQLSVTLNVK